MTSPHGFEPVFIPELAFDFQRHLIEWGVRKGRAAIFSDCGTGKSGMELAFAENVVRHTNEPVLLLTPLAVAAQMVEEAGKFGIDAVRSSDGKFKSGARVIVTNYERLHHFNTNDFAGVVCDECFPKNTPVEVLQNGCILKKNIQDVRNGDTIINAAGHDRVIETHRREIKIAVAVSVGGSRIVASENHPFFTQRGWVPAFDLQSGDSIMETSEAVRLVSGRVRPEECIYEDGAFLRDILLSEMEDAANCHLGEGAFGGSGNQAWQSEECMAQFRISESSPRDREGASNESYGGIIGEDEPDVAHDGPQTFRAWWKREGFNGAAITDAGGTIARMEGGVCRVSWSEGSRLSDVLQTRLGVSRKETRDRGGWSYSPIKEGSGQEERCEAGFVRVDGIEILERGHPELEQWRNAEGVVYFYDLKAERHPSFSVNGLLVHNSGILKNHSGATRNAVIAFLKNTRYRLLGSATPSPNDVTELGNSVEALGIMRRVEMLAQYFIHDSADTGNWRLKGHAFDAFWRFAASWARAIKHPRDIGFDQPGYDLPELQMFNHMLASKPIEGFLIPMEARTLNEQRDERRATIESRCGKVAEIAMADKSQFVAWCSLNSESAMLTSLIPGAVELSGSDDDDEKEEKIMAFAKGQIQTLVTKPKICSHGINWQSCHRMSFFPSHSHEQFYQAVRRFWRFMQKSAVQVHIVTTESEAMVLENMQRKERESSEMFSRIVANMHSYYSGESTTYQPQQRIALPSWINN